MQKIIQSIVISGDFDSGESIGSIRTYLMLSIQQSIATGTSSSRLSHRVKKASVFL